MSPYKPLRRALALLLATSLAIVSCGQDALVNGEDGAVYRVEGLDHPAEFRFYGSTYIAESPELRDLEGADLVFEVESPCAPAHGYVVTMSDATVRIVDDAPEFWRVDEDVPGGCGGLESSSLDFEPGATLTFTDNGMIVLPDETAITVVYLGTQVEAGRDALEGLVDTDAEG